MGWYDNFVESFVWILSSNDKHKGTFLQKLQKSLKSCKKVFGELQKSLRNKENNSYFGRFVLYFSCKRYFLQWKMTDFDMWNIQMLFACDCHKQICA